MLAKLTQARTILIIILVTAGLLLAVASVTTPDKLGPFGITLWFVGLLIVLSGVISLALYRFRTVFRHGQDRPAILTRSLRHGVLAATWLTALLALNSLHQLGFKDVVLVTLLIVTINFYFRRLTP